METEREVGLDSKTKQKKTVKGQQVRKDLKYETKATSHSDIGKRYLNGDDLEDQMLFLRTEMNIKLWFNNDSYYKHETNLYGYSYSEM